ncbi:MAG: S41 family peptidase [Anaerolineae bacterium]
MKRLWMLVWIMLLSSGFTQTITPPPMLPQTEESAAAWREDLQYLVDQVDQRHPDPYRYTSQAEFETIAAAVDQHIPEMTDPQIIVEFMRYTAALTDGHTSFFPVFQTAYPFYAYPLLFYLFSDGVYLVDAAPEQADAIGGRLLGIGTHDAEEVLSRIGALIQHDNESGRRVLIPVNMVTVEVLLGTGLIDDPAQPNFMLELPDHSTVTLNPPAETVAQFLDRYPGHYHLLADHDLPSLAHLDERLWWMPVGEDDHTLYVQYNEVQTLGNALPDLQNAFESGDYSQMILDLRYNGGGDIGTAQRFIQWFRNQDRLQQHGSLIVLIGRNTFSAAVVFSLWLEQDLQPVFIGEPSGGRPLMFENARPITLPNSGLQVYISSRARRDVESSDTRPAIEPDVVVELSSADYFAHRDPALEAALAYPPPVS